MRDQQSFPFFILKLLFSGTLFFSFLSPVLSQTETAPTYDQLPQRVKEAVSFRVQVVDRNYQTDLEGNYSGTLRVDLEIETRNNFLLYEDNLSYKISDHNAPFPENESWEMKEIERPETVSFIDPITKKIKKGFRGQNRFTIELKTPAGYHSIASNYKIPLVMSFQACSEKLCLLPHQVMSRIDFFDNNGPQYANSSSNNSNFEKSFLDTASSQLKSWLDQSSGLSLGILGLLFLAGLLTSFTPCVYPIYPITLGIFSRWTHNSKNEGLLLSLFYCLGMIISYAVFGLITAATGSIFGSLTQQPVYLLSIGGVFLLSAIFFSGIVNLPVPGFLQSLFGTSMENPSEKKPSTAKLCVKASFMGLGMGVLAAPCVGPVLLALLAWLSQSLQNQEASYLKGFVLLSVFGLGMSVPFLILGHLILNMKKKISLGRFTPWVKHLGTVFLVAGSLFFIIPGFKLLNSSQNQTGKEFSFPVYNWENRSTGKWAVYDFRADWCTACIELEERTLMEKEVSSKFESGDWSYVQIDMTKLTDETKKIAEKFNVISLPSVFIVNPEGDRCTNLNLHEFEEAPQFLARMSEAKRNCSIPPEGKDS